MAVKIAAQWWWATVVLLLACGGGWVDVEPQPASQNAGSELAFGGDPANGAVFAVDVSMWEGPISQYEMDCFWDAGARHLVAGTQVPALTRQQLAMATARGFSVDAYVYLNWADPAAQVRQGFETVQGFPIGRMWLDIEEEPNGRSSKVLEGLIQGAIDACRAQGQVPCGIYTGSGFWKTWLNNTPKFADLPLWYAIYNNKTTLSDWPVEKFGGWQLPAAKQFTAQAFCGLAADRNVMQRLTLPQVMVDRSPPPAATAPPGAPTGLYPPDGSVVMDTVAKLMVDTMPGATRYELALESWNGSAFVTYNTWAQATPLRKTSPYWNNHLYRFRARATNAVGVGPWSDWSTFDLGKYTGSRPAPVGVPPPSPPSTTAPPPASGSGPTGLTPAGGQVAGPSVTLSCLPVASATRYQFDVEYGGAPSWVSYTTYLGPAPTRTFWPTVRGTTYRFRVRAELGGSWGDWSAYESFGF